MHIAIVGGIFDKPASYRAKHAISPETTLVDGLRARGLSVTAFGHKNFVSAADFDIIHIHHFGRAAFAMQRRSQRARFIFTSHDGFLMSDLPMGFAKRLTYASVMRSADCVVALSTRERECLTRRYALDPRSLRTIYNGINTEVFARNSAHGSDDYLLFVGQLQAFKGLGYLIEALPRVRGANPSVKLIVAYQTAAMLDHYQALARQHGVEHAVLFAGSKSAQELVDLYSRCSVLVSPGLVECLSTVVLEGMACGCAVVATDVGGVREQLDSESGVIIPPANAVAISDAVCRLLRDPQKRARLGAKAAQVASSKFSVEAMVTAHISMYASLLEGPGRKVKSRDRLLSALVRAYTQCL
jgi:glycosyltransferase involved in cell wall biosynthesis